jgi:signal transduction histidine kinase/ssDNA-specific exonuclease RecJ
MTVSPTVDLAAAERRIQELTRELLAARSELAEARDQQGATTEILRVISRSPLELQRAFAEIAASAARLCDASNAGVVQVDGDHLRVVARHGPIPIEQGRIPLKRGVVIGRAVLDRETVHVDDLQAETDEYPEGSEFARGLGHRTILAIPLIRAGEAIGAIFIRRTEVRPFTDRQIDVLKVFADQAVIAIENTRLFEAEQASKRELQESLEYQTATSEVLGVISRSPTELRPVLDTIARTSQRLCEADRSSVWRLVDRAFVLASVSDHSPAVADYMARAPIPADRTSVAGRCVLEKRTLHVHDRLNEPGLPPLSQSYASDTRTLLCVPLLRKGEPIGVVRLSRDKVAPFTSRQIALVETFADQAVIAIENTRLFEAEQESKRELQESLEYQTAISDVLNVISRSPNRLQPVFDVIAQNASRLCGGEYAIVTRYDGSLIQLVAQHNPRPGAAEEAARLYPLPADPKASPGSRAIVTGSLVHMPDVEKEELMDSTLATYRRISARAILSVPMLHRRQPIGFISVSRATPGPFSNRQIGLLKTFADQAVIAIENARLFEAEQASKRELQESLEYQTATSDVLGVISRSPNELQPVLDMIAQTAMRLCQADRANITRLHNGRYRSVALAGNMTEEQRRAFSDWFTPADRRSITGRVALDGHTVHVHDVWADPASESAPVSSRDSRRTVLGVPLLSDGMVVGVIVLVRGIVKPFTARQIELIETFANQATIAIENTRLFEAEQASKRELTEALEQQTATADVLKVISRSALDVQKVLDALVESAARLCDAYDAAILQVVGDSLRLVAQHGQIPFAGQVGQLTIPLMRGLTATRAIIDRRTIHVADILAEADEYPESRSRAIRQGWRTALAVPLVHTSKAIGVILIRRGEVRPFTERQIELVNTFADQAVIAIENTRLFEEVQTRTRELAKTVEDLEIASQHKNQFVANMSHELRTPLAAILGYAELIQEGFYEPQGPKSLDALTRICSNGKHLLGLINTVLDIAKIESGQFTLNMSEYAIESVVETVRAATESLAQNKKLTLTTSVDKPLPVGLGDEQRLTQVLLNLVGNAIKFTDAGKVRIAAGARNGRFTVSVTDTGPGIPLDQQDRIFDQFHQVDSSLTKAKGGTGLGLAIAKQIVELHGGRIWVESTPGKGSTFQMELPTRAEFRKPVQGS